MNKDVNEPLRDQLDENGRAEAEIDIKIRVLEQKLRDLYRDKDALVRDSKRLKEEYDRNYALAEKKRSVSRPRQRQYNHVNADPDHVAHVRTVQTSLNEAKALSRSSRR